MIGGKISARSARMRWPGCGAAQIGIVFQAFHLIPTMTALENVALPLELGGRRDAFADAAQGLAAVGLGHRLGHYPAQLSGGEQQRVAIARAFIAGPKLLLADEPTGNLDGATGGLVIDCLFEHQARHGTTLLLITHDASLAERCERQIRLADGQIVEDRDRGPDASRRSKREHCERRLRWCYAFRLARRELRGGIAAACASFSPASCWVSPRSPASARSPRRSPPASRGERARAARRRRRGATRLSSGRPCRAAFLAKSGTLSEIATLAGDGAHARTASRQSLIELKAVDAAYPLYGRVVAVAGAGLERCARPVATASSAPSSIAAILDRLGVKNRRHDQDRRSGAAIARHDRARARRRGERADPRPAGHDLGGGAAPRPG